ncbi:transmembrane protein [Tanacetum coccineum]
MLGMATSALTKMFVLITLYTQDADSGSVETKDAGIQLHNVSIDADEWVQNPTAHTTLDEILPCVNNATAQETLYEKMLPVILQTQKAKLREAYKSKTVPRKPEPYVGVRPIIIC